MSLGWTAPAPCAGKDRLRKMRSLFPACPIARCEGVATLCVMCKGPSFRARSEASGRGMLGGVRRNRRAGLRGIGCSSSCAHTSATNRGHSSLTCRSPDQAVFETHAWPRINPQVMMPPPGRRSAPRTAESGPILKRGPRPRCTNGLGGACLLQPPYTTAAEAKWPHRGFHALSRLAEVAMAAASNSP